jgi:hypothetical protein
MYIVFTYFSLVLVKELQDYKHGSYNDHNLSDSLIRDLSFVEKAVKNLFQECRIYASIFIVFV